jgi:hypothetical protein
MIKSNTNQEQRMIRELRRSRSNIRKELQALEQNLANLSIHDAKWDQVMTEFHSSHQTMIEDLCSQAARMLVIPEAHLQNLNNQLKTIQDSLLQVLREKRLATVKAGLQSLEFLQMDERKCQIPAAYKQTYEWIFEDDESAVTRGFSFGHWLRSHDGGPQIFWVRGKPGSGKSTLMRFIQRRLTHHPDLLDLGDGRRVLQAHHYFWNPGTPIQKSISGLLRTLLHQILKQLPKTFPDVVPPAIWEHFKNFGPGVIHQWTDNDLKETLLNIQRQTANDIRIFLLVDGLDEFEGSRAQRQEVIDFLKALAVRESVKICVSSRPWNIYIDAFRSCPQLRLELLTKDDMSIYINGKLLGDDNFLRCHIAEDSSPDPLIDAIVSKAEGVFLWVYLVVLEIIRGASDGDTLRELEEKVYSLPGDLSAYFERMLLSVEACYRHEASALLQTRLTEAGADLTLLDISNFSDKRAEFLANPNFRPIELSSRTVEHLGQQMTRRLNGRCLGLLEVVAPHDERRGVIFSRTLFLHRTVVDYLATDPARELLESFTEMKAYPTDIFLLNTFFARFLAVLFSTDEVICELKSKMVGELFGGVAGMVEGKCGDAQRPSLNSMTKILRSFLWEQYTQRMIPLWLERLLILLIDEKNRLGPPSVPSVPVQRDEQVSASGRKRQRTTSAQEDAYEQHHENEIQRRTTKKAKKRRNRC